MTGPEVMILAGNHNTRLQGRYMFDLSDADKAAEDDEDVIIEEDAWIGARAIILKGVRIGRGAVIGAASVVRKNVPPYCVAAGNPARVVRLRGSIDQIMAHERSLYPEANRLTRQALEAAGRHVPAPGNAPAE